MLNLQIIGERMFNLNILLLLLVVFTTISCNTKKGKSFNKVTTSKSKYVIVKNDFFMRTKILKPNAALLISDKTEIAKNEILFLDNRAHMHSCGYHYAIQFWSTPKNLIEDIPFNQECEEFSRNNREIQSKFLSYIKLLETKPTHYIYNLQLSVKTEPNEVLQSFEKSGLNLFFIDGTSSRYTTLTFTYLQVTSIKEMIDRSKWRKEQDDNAKNAIKKIKSIIDSIQMVSTVIEQSDISFSMQSFGGGMIKDQGKVVLKFKNGTDLKEIKKIIEKNNGVIENENNPEFYYIQLINRSDKLETISKIVKKYDIVKGIYEYPKKQKVIIK